MVVSHTEAPPTLWPPLRTATRRFRDLAKLTAAMTSSGPAQQNAAVHDSEKLGGLLNKGNTMRALTAASGQRDF